MTTDKYRESAMDVCQICCDTRLTKHMRTECKMCEFVCCRNCIKQYLLTLSDDPECMNCHRKLTQEVLLEMLPRSFVDKDLRRHRENVLLDQQRALIPSTQHAVEAMRQRRASMRRIVQLQRERDQLKRRVHELGSLILEEGRTVRERERVVQTQRREFVMRCARANCKGFVSEQYKCAACEGFTCSKCHVFKEDGVEHVCDPDAVATIALLKSDSKRCPSCQTWVHRYEGCSQMWCTHCNTMFDYLSLRVIGHHESFHNPHFTEWLAANRPGARGAARDQGDIPCGGMPHQTHLNTFLQRLVAASDMPQDVVYTVLRMHRVLLDVEYVHVPRYRPRVDDDELERMRVKFCLDDFDEAHWKQQLQRTERRRVKRNEIFLVLQMLVHAGGDLFRQMVTPEARATSIMMNVDKVFEEILGLVCYGNEQLLKVGEAFHCTVPMLTVTGLIAVNAVHGRMLRARKVALHPLSLQLPR